MKYANICIYKIYFKKLYRHTCMYKRNYIQINPQNLFSLHIILLTDLFVK